MVVGMREMVRCHETQESVDAQRASSPGDRRGQGGTAGEGRCQPRKSKLRSRCCAGGGKLADVAPKSSKSETEGEVFVVDLLCGCVVWCGFEFALVAQSRGPRMQCRHNREQVQASHSPTTEATCMYKRDS